MRTIGLWILFLYSCGCLSKSSSFLPSKFHMLAKSEGCNFKDWEKQHPNYEFPPFAELKSGKEIIGLVCKDKIYLKLGKNESCPNSIEREGNDTLIRGLKLSIYKASAPFEVFHTKSKKDVVTPGEYLKVTNIYDGVGYSYYCVGKKWVFTFVH